MLKIIATGNLGKDAVVNTVGQTNVINFSVGHTEKWKDASGQAMEKTTWLECAKWGEKTGLAAYLKKGTKVLIEGTPEVVTYVKNDGSTGVSFKVRIASVELMGSKPQEGTNGQQSAPQAQEQPLNPQQAIGSPASVSDDDLPF